MLPLLSRTVTGVFTSETLTPIFASRCGGACWIAVPGCGEIGPDADCARREGAPARNAAAAAPKSDLEMGERFMIEAKPPRTVYPIRRSFEDKRCRERYLFLRW